MKFTILTKLLLTLLILSIVPLIAVGYISFADVKDISTTARTSAESMGAQATADATKALNDLGENIIKQKASDVAKQTEIYLKLNPTKTLADLQNDEYFKAIAVQVVGDTGYTSIMDTDNGLFYFHPQAAKVNTDTHALATALPAVWTILDGMIGKYKESAGYYDWKETDGSIRQKYMALTVVPGQTGDGKHLFVAATTYIDEFNKPVVAIKNKLTAAVDSTVKKIAAFAQKMLMTNLYVLVVVVIIVIFVGIAVASGISKPIKALRKAADDVTAGNFDTMLPEIKTTDEVADLTASMEMLIAALKMKK